MLRFFIVLLSVGLVLQPQLTLVCMSFIRWLHNPATEIWPPDNSKQIKSDAGCLEVAVKPSIILYFFLRALCSYLYTTWALIYPPYSHFRDSGVPLIDRPASRLHRTASLLVAGVTDSFSPILALGRCNLCDCEEEETADETLSILHFGKQQRRWENGKVCSECSAFWIEQPPSVHHTSSDTLSSWRRVRHPPP